MTAILHVRDGDWPAARAKLATHEVKQMHNHAALARTLDALCIEQLKGERRHVDRVALFGGASTEELQQHWPELMAFIERAPAW